MIPVKSFAKYGSLPNGKILETREFLTRITRITGII
jgi:hypothetical protein